MYAKYFKRPLDFIMALFALIVLSPVLLIVAILVRIKLGSPVIFKQQRPGLNEEIFTLYKFRTMHDAVDATGVKLTEKQRVAILEKGKKEDQYTSDAHRMPMLGRVLRASSLDELPELFNILMGEMSFIGPRPLSTIYLPYYNTDEKQRHNVRPGLTGLAQINGRNALDWVDRFAYDLKYVNDLTFKTDMYILWRTFAIIFDQEGIKQAEEKPEAFHIVRQRESEANKNISMQTQMCLENGKKEKNN